MSRKVDKIIRRPESQGREPWIGAVFSGRDVVLVSDFRKTEFEKKLLKAFTEMETGQPLAASKSKVVADRHKLSLQYLPDYAENWKKSENQKD